MIAGMRVPSLLIAIQRLADEVRALETAPSEADMPRTDAFRSGTLAARAFAAELASVAAAFPSAPAVAAAVEKIRRYFQ